MAWITVDQKLIGGKLRDFAKRSGISQNEAIGILIRLWLWGIDNAEESGRIVAAEHEDIEEAIRPGFLEIDRSTISNIVDNLIECGSTKRMAPYICMTGWTGEVTIRHMSRRKRNMRNGCEIIEPERKRARIRNRRKSRKDPERRNVMSMQ